MKNILAENMRRFGTKNLNEQTADVPAEPTPVTGQPATREIDAMHRVSNQMIADLQTLKGKTVNLYKTADQMPENIAYVAALNAGVMTADTPTRAAEMFQTLAGHPSPITYLTDDETIREPDTYIRMSQNKFHENDYRIHIGRISWQSDNVFYNTPFRDDNNQVPDLFPLYFYRENGIPGLAIQFSGTPVYGTPVQDKEFKTFYNKQLTDVINKKIQPKLEELTKLAGLVPASDFAARGNTDTPDMA